MVKIFSTIMSSNSIRTDGRFVSTPKLQNVPIPEYTRFSRNQSTVSHSGFTGTVRHDQHRRIAGVVG
jgi:hypothetical protein